MVLCEFLAFEILTLSSSWLGPTQLAAQSVLGSITGITFQIPFPMSVAASTRIANLIGATLANPAKKAATVAIMASVIIGTFNLLLLSVFRESIPRLFTPDEDVIRLVADLLPLCAMFQVFDAVAANCNGILRGLGRQEIGGYVGLFAYYVIGIPISFGLGFGAKWGLYGLWSVSCPDNNDVTNANLTRDQPLLLESLRPLRESLSGVRAGKEQLRMRRLGMLQTRVIIDYIHFDNN